MERGPTIEMQYPARSKSASACSKDSQPTLELYAESRIAVLRWELTRFVQVGWGLFTSGRRIATEIERRRVFLA